jgi:Ran GTPase-activating protein (RanGAP) involved in mRNA processing and transport
MQDDESDYAKYYDVLRNAKAVVRSKQLLRKHYASHTHATAPSAASNPGGYAVWKYDKLLKLQSTPEWQQEQNKDKEAEEAAEMKKIQDQLELRARVPQPGDAVQLEDVSLELMAKLGIGIPERRNLVNSDWSVQPSWAVPRVEPNEFKEHLRRIDAENAKMEEEKRLEALKANLQASGGSAGASHGLTPEETRAMATSLARKDLIAIPHAVGIPLDQSYSSLPYKPFRQPPLRPAVDPKSDKAKFAPMTIQMITDSYTQPLDPMKLDGESIDFSKMLGSGKLTNDVLEQVYKIAAVIGQNNPTLKRVNLEFKHITDSVLKYLSAACAKNTHLMTLALNSNEIGDGGARSMSAVLYSNKFHLVELYLGGNQVGDIGATYLAKSLENNKMLAELNVCGKPEPKKNLWAGKSKIPIPRIGHKGAIAFGAALCHRNSTLTDLHLGDNRIGDKGAQAIAAALEHNSTLIYFQAPNNRISSDGARSLGHMLKVNRCLQHLDLGRNIIEDEGAEFMSFCVRMNPALTTLDLSMNRLTNEGASHFVEAVASKTHVCTVFVNGDKVSMDMGKAVIDAGSSVRAKLTQGLRKKAVQMSCLLEVRAAQDKKLARGPRRRRKQSLWKDETSAAFFEAEAALAKIAVEAGEKPESVMFDRRGSHGRRRSHGGRKSSKHHGSSGHAHFSTTSSASDYQHGGHHGHTHHGHENRGAKYDDYQ